MLHVHLKAHRLKNRKKELVSLSIKAFYNSVIVHHLLEGEHDFNVLKSFNVMDRQ